MTVAISKAVERGAHTVICASTGNTAASAAAYAARAGLVAVVLQPEGAVASGKLAQARALGARVLEVRGSFDETLSAARALADRGTHVLVNSLNPDRLEGQKTAAFEIVEELRATPGRARSPLRRRRQSDGVRASASPRAAALPRLVAGEAAERATTARVRDPDRSACTRRDGCRGARVVRRRRRPARRRGDPRRVARARSRGGRLLRAILRRRTRRARLGRARAGLDRRRASSPGTGSRTRTPRRGSARARRRRSRSRTRSRQRRDDRPSRPCARKHGEPRAGIRLRGGGARSLERARGDGGRRRGRPRPPRRPGVRAPRARRRPTFAFVDRIPRERGLGSSAAVIALGLTAANVVAGLGFGAEELLAEGVELEGHADNLAAALAGGVCLTWDTKIARLADDAPAVPIALVPEATVSTAAARAALPGRCRTGTRRSPPGAPRCSAPRSRRARATSSPRPSPTASTSPTARKAPRFSRRPRASCPKVRSAPPSPAPARP